MGDLDKFSCRNKNCSHYNIRGGDNIRVRSLYGKNKDIRLLYCLKCKKKFSERRDTHHFDSRLSRKKVDSIIKHVAAGDGVRKTSRLLNVNPITVSRYAKLTGTPSKQFRDKPVASSRTEQRSAARREERLRAPKEKELQREQTEQQAQEAKKKEDAKKKRAERRRWSEQERADWNNLDPQTIVVSEIDARLPVYRLNKTTGEAFVCTDGNIILKLGIYDSLESKRDYHRHVSEWLKTHQKNHVSDRLPDKYRYVPKYRLHKASGQALVELSGKRTYCGKYGTPESKEEYKRLVEEWIANGRKLPPESAEASDR